MGVAWDTSEAVSGGMAGAGLGPYGAAAGFVLGGFLGGARNRGEKKRMRTRERQIRRRLSPAYYKQKLQEFTPIARQNVLESGAGNVIKQEVQGNISRRGLTGTGLGTAFQNAAALAPANIASTQAQNMASSSINNEISSISGFPMFQSPEQLSRGSASDIATAIAIFKSLKKKGGTNSDGTPDFRSQFPNNDWNSGWPSSVPKSAFNPGDYMPKFPNAMGG